MINTIILSGNEQVFCLGPGNVWLRLAIYFREVILLYDMGNCNICIGVPCGSAIVSGQDGKSKPRCHAFRIVMTFR